MPEIEDKYINKIKELDYYPAPIFVYKDLVLMFKRSITLSESTVMLL